MEKVCPKEYKDRAHKKNVYNMGVYSRQGVEKSLGIPNEREKGFRKREW